MPPHALKRRLAAMPSGEWLVRPGSGFDRPTVRPFLATSLPALPGHPASAHPLSDTDELLFPGGVRTNYNPDRTGGRGEKLARVPTSEGAQTKADADTDGKSETDESVAQSDIRLNTRSSPHTTRLPRIVFGWRTVRRHTPLRCIRCENRYDP